MFVFECLCVRTHLCTNSAGLGESGSGRPGDYVRLDSEVSMFDDSLCLFLVRSAGLHVTQSGPLQSLVVVNFVGGSLV